MHEVTKRTCYRFLNVSFWYHRRNKANTQSEKNPSQYPYLAPKQLNIFKHTSNLEADKKSNTQNSHLKSQATLHTLCLQASTDFLAYWDTSSEQNTSVQRYTLQALQAPALFIQESRRVVKIPRTTCTAGLLHSIFTPARWVNNGIDFLSETYQQQFLMNKWEKNPKWPADSVYLIR